jgi:hypothetical protein
MAYIVYLLNLSTPEHTEILYCGRSERSAEYYRSHCPQPCGMYALLPWAYFPR